LRNEIVMRSEPLTESTLVEIVDEIFLPLIGEPGTPKARTLGGDGAGP
jgi:hypothetical protein